MAPDAVVMSVGLWHMLHIDDPADYAKQLQALRHAIHGFVSASKVQPNYLTGEAVLSVLVRLHPAAVLIKYIVAALPGQCFATHVIFQHL